MKKKYWIIPLSVIGRILALLVILYFVLTTNTQIIVGLLQKATYGDAPINSYQPFYEPINGVK